MPQTSAEYMIKYDSAVAKLSEQSTRNVHRVTPNMHFVQITESVTIEEVTSKVKGLIVSEADTMEESLRNSKINFSRRDQDCIETECSGLTIINFLGRIEYKVYGQSMAIEETGIGGRTIVVQKLVWIMGK